jgi:hypothetical protein
MRQGKTQETEARRQGNASTAYEEKEQETVNREEQVMSRIRKRLTFANVGMTLAIVFAMSGGAYAAKKYMIISVKQIKPSVVAELRGKDGRAGTPGAVGAQGLPGPEGKAGTNGTNGKDGAPGATGPAGATGPKGATGSAGTSGATGAAGPKGATGEPWTPNNVLPSNASETGTWSVAGMPPRFVLVPNIAEPEWMFASISFPIKLSAELKSGKVQVIPPGENGKGGGCPVTSNEEKPQAEKGNLCIFQGQPQLNVGVVQAYDPVTAETGEAATSGALVEVRPNVEKSPVSAFGTWAVTAE